MITSITSNNFTVTNRCQFQFKCLLILWHSRVQTIPCATTRNYWVTTCDRIYSPVLALHWLQSLAITRPLLAICFSGPPSTIFGPQHEQTFRWRRPDWLAGRGTQSMRYKTSIQWNMVWAMTTTWVGMTQKALQAINFFPGPERHINHWLQRAKYRRASPSGPRRCCPVGRRALQ